MRPQRFDNIEQAETALLRPIKASKVKAPNLSFDGGEAFTVCFSEDGASVGINRYDNVLVFNTTLEVGSTYIMHGDDYDIKKIEDVVAFKEMCEALKIANAKIQDYSYNGRKPGWNRHGEMLRIQDLDGDFTKEKVAEAFDAMKLRVEAIVESAESERKAREKEVAEKQEEWEKKPHMVNRSGGSQVVYDGSTITDNTIDGSYTISLDDKCSVSKHFSLLDATSPGFSTVSTIMRHLESSKADFTVEWKPLEGEATKVHLRCSGEFPVVDTCVSKSRRPIYLAMKKLKGKCTAAQLYSYEKMSGIKAKLLEIDNIVVNVERPDRKEYRLQVPVCFTLNSRDPSNIDVKIGSSFEGVAGYIGLKGHLCQGLRVSKKIDADEFISIMELIGVKREDALGELRKRWQVEAI